MNKEQLPKLNEVCYVTVKIDPNTEIEELGYLTSYPVEPRKFKENLGYYDQDTDLFRHFLVTVPIIEWDFSIEDLVSWRVINNWNNIVDKAPIIGSIVLCFDSENQCTFMGRVKEIVSEPVKHFVLADPFDEEYYEVIGTADFWMMLPTPPNKK